MVKHILPPLLLFLSFCLPAHADWVVAYTYDAAGNRTSRKCIEIVLPALRSARADPIDSSEVEVELEALKVTIYPNPTIGSIQVGLQPYDPKVVLRFILFDPEGKVLGRYTPVSELTPVDLSPYPAGWYLLHVETAGKPLYFKIIKQ